MIIDSLEPFREFVFVVVCTGSTILVHFQMTKHMVNNANLKSNTFSQDGWNKYLFLFPKYDRFKKKNKLR